MGKSKAAAAHVGQVGVIESRESPPVPDDEREPLASAALAAFRDDGWHVRSAWPCSLLFLAEERAYAEEKDVGS